MYVYDIEDFVFGFGTTVRPTLYIFPERIGG